MLVSTQTDVIHKRPGFLQNWLHPFGALVLVAVIGIISYFIEPYIGYRAIGFIFLLTVLIIGTFASISVVIFSACLSTFAWNYFFIHPKFTFRITTADDFLMCLAFFVVALITGFLTNRIRFHETIIREREERTNVLYEILQIIASAQEKSEFITKVCDRVGSLLVANCGVLLKSESGRLQFADASNNSVPLDDDNRQVALWCFENNKTAGWSTANSPLQNSFFIPLKGQSEVVGVFVFQPLQATRKMDLDKENLLLSIVRQLGISIERHFLTKRLAEAQRLQDSEKLHQTLLSSISHEMRTPLTAIMASAWALEDQQLAQDPNYVKSIAVTLQESSDRLNRVIENLLDMSRLSSGVLSLKLEWHDVHDLFGVVRQKLAKPVSKHILKIEIADHLPLLKIDFRLIEHAISNVILNAALYTPPGSEIVVTVTQLEQYLQINIQDDGPGIPPQDLPKIFDKFYRVPGSPTGGTGLGLSIVKSIIELHKGTIHVNPVFPHGVCFTIQLPIEAQPLLPTEGT